jgi:RNA polymerase sigma-70 factor, ECF subfamily
MPEIGDAVSSGSTLPTRTAATELTSSISGSEPLSALPDERLILLAQSGEEAAFSEFVRRHTATVHRWMARSVGEQDADDMTQEVLLKAYRGLPKFRGDAPPRAWLASIADNAVKNRYRSRGRFRRIFAGSTDEETAPDPVGRDADPEEHARASESRTFVTEALARLAVEFRMPVVLRDLEEWSYEEIAASLDLPIGTVKSRIARGRAQLKELLAPRLNPGMSHS